MALRGGILFKPFELIETEELVKGADDDSFIRIQRLKFSIKDNVMGIEQPFTHIKIRRPDSYLRSRTYSVINRKQDDFIEIIVKVYKDGSMCRYLGDIPVGTVCYIAKTRTKTIADHQSVGLISFGIGITEMIQTAKLSKNTKLLCIYKTKKEVLFEEEFKKMGIQVYYLFSRDTVDGCFHGRLDADILNKVFDKNDSMLCIGSKQMMRSCYQLLNEHGFSKRLLQ